MSRRKWCGAILSAAVTCLGAGHTCAQELERKWCARAVATDPLKPRAETARARVNLTGAALDSTLQRTVVGRLIQAQVWPSQPTEVFIEPWTESNCVAAEGREITIEVEISADEVEALRAELSRGSDALQTVRQLAKRAVMSLDLASSTLTEQREWLRLYFATNRQRTGREATAEAFSDERSDALQVGTVDVSVRRQQRMRPLDNPSVLRFEAVTSPIDVAVAGSWQALDIASWRAELRDRAARFGRPGVLLFVHGYNVTFTEAAQRAGQLAYDLAFPGPTVFMSWPSDAKVVRYLQDGRDAENSWAVMERLLDELTSINRDGPVHVVAHSMDNRVMLGGLAGLLERDPDRRRAVASVVMAAPDIDQDSFRLNWARKVLNLGIPFTLYASDRDLTMSFSAALQGGRRLGHGGVALFRTRGLDSVDASAVTREMFGLNHSYFGDEATVLSDLFFLLRQGIPADRRPYLKRLEPYPASVWAIR